MFSYTYKTWCFSEMKIKPNLEIEICKNLLSSIDALLEIPQGSFVAFVGSQVVVQPWPHPSWGGIFNVGSTNSPAWQADTVCSKPGNMVEQSRRASLPEIVQTDVDQTTQAIENLSIFEKIKKTFPTTSRKTSDSSEGSSEERRDSLRSSCSWGGAAESRRGSGVSTFGNHGIFGPLLGLEETPEPKREKCLLSRRWSAISIAWSQIRCAVCKLFVQFLIRSNNFLLSPPVPQLEQEYTIH